MNPSLYGHDVKNLSAFLNRSGLSSGFLRYSAKCWVRKKQFEGLEVKNMKMSWTDLADENKRVAYDEHTGLFYAALEVKVIIFEEEILVRCERND